MKILAIGNSFSEDCTAHLGRMCDVYVRNLYIGGCSLERHARNLEEQIADYQFQKDAIMLGERLVSANEILAAESWDVITLQQVSHAAPFYKTYQPYLDELAAYVRRAVPRAGFGYTRCAFASLP